MSASGAIYPGSFDPITNGHVDIILRGAEVFDRLIVLVAVNSEKKTLFSLSERLELIREVFKDHPKVEVDSFEGLLVRYMKSKDVRVVIRGLRAVSDFEYEFQMALMNRKLEGEVTTVFLMPHEKYTYLNSGIVREIARAGGDVSEFVPPGVRSMLRKKFKRR